MNATAIDNITTTSSLIDINNISQTYFIAASSTYIINNSIVNKTINSTIKTISNGAKRLSSNLIKYIDDFFNYYQIIKFV